MSCGWSVLWELDYSGALSKCKPLVWFSSLQDSNVQLFIYWKQCFSPAKVKTSTLLSILSTTSQNSSFASTHHSSSQCKKKYYRRTLRALLFNEDCTDQGKRRNIHMQIISFPLKDPFKTWDNKVLSIKCPPRAIRQSWQCQRSCIME